MNKETPGFFEDVVRNFDKAVAILNVPPGLADQIRQCNSVYKMRFPVRMEDGIQVIEAYRVEHSHHRLPTKGAYALRLT